MAKDCPIYGKAIYLYCLECEDKICNSKKLCFDCKHRKRVASNFRCEFTGDAKNCEHSMRYECGKYEKE